MGVSEEAEKITEQVEKLTRVTDLLYVLYFTLRELNGMDSVVFSQNKRARYSLSTKRLVSFITESRHYHFKFKEGDTVQFSARVGKRLVKGLNPKEFVRINRNEYISKNCVNATADQMVYLTDNSCRLMSKKGKERLEKSLKECYHGASNNIGRVNDDK